MSAPLAVPIAVCADDPALKGAAVTGMPPRRLLALDPRAKVLLGLGLAATVASTPAGAWSAFGGYGALLAGLLALAAAPVGLTATRLVRFVPWIVMLALPVCLVGPAADGAGAAAAIWPALPGSTLGLTVMLKALLGLGAMLLMCALLPLTDLLRGLTGLGVPRVLVTQLHLTWRYIAVLREESLRMQIAYAARGGQRRWLWQAGGLGYLIGALFVRSAERAERVEQAMLARGFDGVSLTGARDESAGGEKFGWREWLWLAAVGLLLTALRGWSVS